MELAPLYGGTHIHVTQNFHKKTLFAIPWLFEKI